MAHIRQAAWPLVIKFRLPLDEDDVFSLAKIAEMRYVLGDHLPRSQAASVVKYCYAIAHTNLRVVYRAMVIAKKKLTFSSKDRSSLPKTNRQMQYADATGIKKGPVLASPTMRHAYHRKARTEQQEGFLQQVGVLVSCHFDRADGRFSEDIVLEHLKRKLLRGQVHYMNEKKCVCSGGNT